MKRCILLDSLYSYLYTLSLKPKTLYRVYTVIYNAQRAKHTYKYKNIKEKLYKCNAAIWYNKSCKQKQLTLATQPSVNNPQCRKTIKAATHYRLNQELKFLYVKKQKLGEQLYKIHLEWASFRQNNWYIIQSSNDNKLQRQMETYYTHLNTKLGRLQAKQQQQTRTSLNNQKQQQFYPRIKNLTNIKFTKEETEVLSYGLQYSIAEPLTTNFTNLVIEMERAIKLLDTKLQNSYRITAASELKQILNSGNNYNILQKGRLYTMKQLNQIKKKLLTENAILVRAVKGKTIVITKSDAYSNKVHTLLAANNFPSCFPKLLQTSIKN